MPLDVTCIPDICVPAYVSAPLDSEPWYRGDLAVVPITRKGYGGYAYVQGTRMLRMDGVG